MSFKNKGFTLIELLIVVAIIAILAAIAVPNFLEAQTRSKVSRVKADMRSIATALESYQIDNNKYPPMAEKFAGDVTYPTGNAFHSRVPNYITTPIAYMTSIPLDPFVNVQNPGTFTSATFPASTRVGERFVYFNYKEILDSTASPSQALRDRATDAGSWLMYGYGPDQDAFNRVNFTGANQSVYINYDPTNGTISQGNIFRTQATNDAYVDRTP